MIWLCAAAHAQEYRATILGFVQDPTRSAVAGAKVRAVKTDTGVPKETVTNADGIYSLIGLEPGRYDVTITADGFQTTRRQGIVVQVAQKLNLAVTLEVGQISQEITVVGEQEIIQTATASRGLVFDPVKMQEIPLNGRQAYMLMRLSPGVMFTQRTFGSSGFSGTRAWDVNGSFTMNGGRTGTNQFLLNGAPISTQGSFNLAPNVEAVQEMKVMVNTYDSQYGRSGGGHVNTTLKSGTNDWHGSVFDFWRNRVLDANTRQNNAAGSPRGFRNQHQYGGILGGPIRKNSDFIFLSFEGWQERVPFPSVATVPPAEMRNGAFNFTPAGLPGPVRVYDPMTSASCITGGANCISGGIYVRQPFPNHIIPASRISPIGRAILGYYPAPNFNPQSLQQNFIRPDNTGRYRYEQPIVRYDKVVTQNARLYFMFTFQDGSEFRNQNGFDAPAQTGNMPGTVRRDQNYVLSYDRTMSPTRLLHVQASYNRFVQNFPDVSDYSFTWDKIGIRNMPQVDTFPSRLTPRITVSGYANLFGNQFQNESSRQQLNFQANLSETRGRHTVKYGFEWAQLMRHARASGRASGELGFNGQWSRQYFGRGQGPTDGSSVADLLLGSIWSGFVAYNDTFFRREPYIGLFVQDDWKVGNSFTLNLGLRYDVQYPFTEIHDRVVSGFDFSTPQAFQDEVLARWRQNTSTNANYPAAPGAIAGGLRYAGVNGVPRRVYDFDYSNIQPRLGFAWNFLPKTVMRGGIGIFHRTATQDSQTTGYSLNTDYIRSVDGDRTPRSLLAGPYSPEYPFPDGVVRPRGSADGIATNVGGGVGYDGRQRLIPRTFQWSYTLERELPGNMVLEVSYVGSLTNKEPRGINLSDMSREHYEAAVRNPNFYQQTVPNPYFGSIARNRALGAAPTIQRRELFRRIPGYTGVTINTNPWGRTWYHGLQTRFERRMMGERSRAGALTWVMAYTWSKQLENALRQNFTFEWMPFINQVTDADRTHNFSFAGIWDLPFGKGRTLGADMGRAGQFLLGGWTANVNFIYQSGVPLGAWTGWEFLCGDPTTGARTERSWFFNDATRFRQCWEQNTPFELVQLPARFGQIRSHTAPQVDVMLSKKFNVNERWQLEFRGEAFNVSNTPLRGDPPSGNPQAADFGILPVQQLNFSRNVQLGFRLRF
jgi:hypothetical protein